jgi:hypothetical protein
VDYADFIRKLQLPTGFTVPTELAYEDLVARTITRDHLRDDVRGINASIELIQRTRGGRWPTGPVTEAGNFADLVWHEVEFRDGGSFTYAACSSGSRSGSRSRRRTTPTRRFRARSDVLVDEVQGVEHRRPGCMRGGLGLPAAVPEVDMRVIGGWAAGGERAGFDSVGVFDRLVYDNLEPLTALAAAAARTEHVELLTTVLTVGWRNNPVLLALQIASVDLLSGGRLTVGLGLGGWPDDCDTSEVSSSGQGAVRALVGDDAQGLAGRAGGRGGPDATVDGGSANAAIRRSHSGRVQPGGHARREMGGSAVRHAGPGGRRQLAWGRTRTRSRTSTSTTTTEMT